MIAFDGPGGTQVPRECIDATASYLSTSNANTHGRFAASMETTALLAEVHAAGADFLGATDPGEISFGPNMTTLTFALGRAIGRTIRPGDELVVTRLDHDANVAPWLALEEERGAAIRWVDVRTEDCTLDLTSLGAALSDRTRVVAVGLASNAVGTINPVAEIASMARDVGALTYVDAVHAAPHLPLDVAALGADFVVCSPYKFFAPHLGMLWGRRELMESLPAYKVRPAGDGIPDRWETGTGLHENLAGLLGTFRYLEWLTGDDAVEAGRRDRLVAAMTRIREYEVGLMPHLLERLNAIPGLHMRGIRDPDRLDERVPTVAFTMDGHAPSAVSTFLGDRGISTWDGDYYAYELIRTLGLAQSGGMVRVGLVHYNTIEEIDALGDALEELASG